MAADVNDIVCLGYGSWSSVNWLPTLGFGIGEAAAAVMPGLEFAAPENRFHYSAPANRFHFTAPVNRMHFSAPEE